MANDNQSTELDRLLSLTNIAEELDEKELADIGKDVVQGFKLDEESRSDYLKKNEEWMKLATQVAEKKSTPWPNAANVKYPLLTIAAVQFSSRAYPALVKYPKTVKSRVIGKDPDRKKAESAARIAGHMNFQIFEQMEEWEEDMDKLTMILPIAGCVFKKSYYDPLQARNVSETVLAKDLAINYYASSLETAVRKTQILELMPNDIHERVASDMYLKVNLTHAQPDNTRKDSSDKIQGIKPPGTDTEANTPRVILEQHTFLDLDDDGYREPYIVTVDLITSKVLRVVARFDAEGIDVNTRGEIIRIKPVEYFTKFGFIPNPDGGIYDLGFGLLLGSLNNTANTLINQLLDSGTLHNQQSGFISRGIRMKGGVKRFAPHEWKVVNATGDDLRKGIVPLPTKEPSNVLFQLLGLIIESGEKLASVMDVLVGQNPGQNQPASTTMAVIEQGLKVFTAIHKRNYRSLKAEFKKLYRLNKLHLDEEEYYTVLDDDEESAQSIFQTDYVNNNADVLPAADPNITTEMQRLVKAQALLELLPLGLNPQVVAQRNLEAQEQPNIAELLDVPEQEPPFDEKLAQAEFEHKVEHDSESLILERDRVRNESIKDFAVAMLSLAKADSEESKITLEQFRAQIDGINSYIDKTIAHDQNEQNKKESVTTPTEDTT